MFNFQQYTEVTGNFIIKPEKFWLINGEWLTDEEYNRRYPQNNCDGKIIEIDGLKYELKLIK